MADGDAERPQADAAVGGGGQERIAGLPEVQRMSAGEVVQVDVVADASVGLAQLHCGAELLGEDRDDRVAEDFDGRPVEQGRQADRARPGRDGVAEVDVEFEPDFALARVQSIDRRTPRYRSVSRVVAAVVVEGSKPMPSASSTRATSLVYPMTVS